MKVNQKIEVARRGEGEFYPAMIQDVTGDVLCITVPYLRGVPLVLVPGEHVLARVIESDAAYEFTSTVLGRRRDAIPLYALALPTELKRVQRRRCVRLDTLLDVWYAPLPERGREPVFRAARAVDISGSGMRLAADQELAIGERLLLRFTLEVDDREIEIETVARVVRRDAGEEAQGRSGYRYRYRYGIEFVDLPLRTQDQIVRYIFRRMAEQRKLR